MHKNHYSNNGITSSSNHTHGYQNDLLRNPGVEQLKVMFKNGQQIKFGGQTEFRITNSRFNAKPM